MDVDIRGHIVVFMLCLGTYIKIEEVAWATFLFIGAVVIGVLFIHHDPTPPGNK